MTTYRQGQRRRDTLYRFIKGRSRRTTQERDSVTHILQGSIRVIRNFAQDLASRRVGTRLALEVLQRLQRLQTSGGSGGSGGSDRPLRYAYQEDYIATDVCPPLCRYRSNLDATWSSFFSLQKPYLITKTLLLSPALYKLAEAREAV